MLEKKRYHRTNRTKSIYGHASSQYILVSNIPLKLYIIPNEKMCLYSLPQDQELHSSVSISTITIQNYCIPLGKSEIQKMFAAWASKTKENGKECSTISSGHCVELAFNISRYVQELVTNSNIYQYNLHYSSNIGNNNL